MGSKRSLLNKFGAVPLLNKLHVVNKAFAVTPTKSLTGDGALEKKDATSCTPSPICTFKRTLHLAVELEYLISCFRPA